MDGETPDVEREGFADCAYLDFIYSVHLLVLRIAIHLVGCVETIHCMGKIKSSQT